MSSDNSQSKEEDLDRTDKLPVLEGVEVDDDVADDAVRFDHTAVLPAGTHLSSASARADFARPPGVDLPSLAESVRTVEERIARQSAEYEALGRLYDKSRDAESGAVTRAEALSAELANAQAALAVEQQRTRELDRALADRHSAMESTRTRTEEALREAERYQSESRTLRDSLAARDATIVQVLHSLGERDAQLHALQREHAQTVPALEARSQASAQLEAELHKARARIEALQLELKNAEGSAAALAARRTHGEAELAAARLEIGALKARAAAYLETLRTRDWRLGFNQNLFREWDEKMDAARAGHGALQAERDGLKQTAAALSTKLVEQEAAIAKLQGTVRELEHSQHARAELAAQLEAGELERKGLRSQLTAGEQALAQARAERAAAAQSAEQQAAEVTELKAEAETHEQEMTVLMAHLNEARRPVQSIQADLKRATEDLAAATASLERLTLENQTLKTNLERTRGALEEREFLIRRLERSESNNANVLGRIQTSIERLGSTPASATGAAAAVAECSAQFVRFDGEHTTVHELGRRTRIGRAPGCEVQIDSSSVSRHHALLLKGTRELIIEDLNSTNGVVVNGRKISRQLLNDGDVVTIGEVQFRCVLKAAAGPTSSPSGG
jgi:chromosome segregation ATPase